MKLTLRVTLTAILLTLILLTVAALGYTSYVNAHFTARDLSKQILDQTAQRVDVQINDLLRTANKQGTLNERLLQSGQLDVRNFPQLASYWLEVMKVHTRLTRMSVGLEASGEWYYVRRKLDGQLAIGELRRNAATTKLELSDYLPQDYPARPFYFNADKSDEDPRQRPWYLAAKNAGRQAWSETYVFFGVRGVADVPGVSCATPIYGADGALTGVLTSSFDVYELCTFLKDLSVGTNGYAFVVEFRADGSRRVVAHPKSEILLRVVPAKGDDVRELVPPEELSDHRIAAFLNNVPAAFHLADSKEIGRFRFDVDDVRYFGSYQCLTSADTPHWLICVVLPESDVLERVQHSNQVTAMIGICIVVFAMLVSLYVSRLVSQPLARVAHETEAMGRLELDAHPIAHSPVLEVDRLAVAVEETKTSLRSFQKYVPADLVRLLLSTGKEAALGGESRRLTFYFCDLADFTAVSERLSPEDLVQHLSAYFGTFSAEILATGGTVDKYIGDAIMAFWGAPSALPGHALAACTSALRNQASLKTLRTTWQAEGKPLLRARIGINTGDAVVGNIGNVARLNYTVMGDAVNLASRLEGLNKFYGTDVLISEFTYREAKEAVFARPVDWVSVKGKSEAVLIYELLGFKQDIDPGWQVLAERAAEALALYRGRDWAGALRLFEQILRSRAEDGPARVLAARCAAYVKEPPADDWAGVHRMETK